MKSYWIWNFGDWEIFHTNLVNSRREQYGMEYPPFWRMYDVDRYVVLFAEKDIPSDGFLKLHLHGKGYLKIEGRMYPSEKEIPVTKGKHTFQIHVMNLTGLPAAYIPTGIGSPLTNVEKKYLRALTKGIPRRSQTPKFSPFHTRPFPLFRQRK